MFTCWPLFGQKNDGQNLDCLFCSCSSSIRAVSARQSHNHTEKQTVIYCTTFIIHGLSQHVGIFHARPSDLWEQQTLESWSWRIFGDLEQEKMNCSANRNWFDSDSIEPWADRAVVAQRPGQKRHRSEMWFASSWSSASAPTKLAIRLLPLTVLRFRLRRMKLILRLVQPSRCPTHWWVYRFTQNCRCMKFSFNIIENHYDDANDADNVDDDEINDTRIEIIMRMILMFFLFPYTDVPYQSQIRRLVFEGFVTSLVQVILRFFRFGFDFWIHVQPEFSPAKKGNNSGMKVL